MKARGGLALGAFTLVALLAFASVTMAKPGYFVKPKNLQLKLTLPASDGYSASLSTNGHRQVTLTVSKGDFVGSAAMSASPGSAASRKSGPTG